MRKIIIISTVLILLGLGAWFFFGRSGAPISQTLSNLSPFGNGEGTVPSGTGSRPGTTGTSTPSGAPAHLFMLSDAPVAGAVAFTNKAGSLDVRYVDRATGHIYDIDPASLAKTEIVNTTIPKVYKAVWKPDGSIVIMQTLESDGDTVDSVAITLLPPSGTSTSDLYTEKTSVLPTDISELGSGSDAVYYTVRGQPRIIQSLFDGSKATTIFSAVFDEWQLDGAGASGLTVTTKPASGLPGYSYTLNPKSGALQKLFGPLDALSVLPNKNRSRVLYSFETGGAMQLSALNLSSGFAYNITPTTLADKCVWSVKASSVIYCGVPLTGLEAGEPDLWYQGISHYSDRIWRFDVDTDYAAVEVDPTKDFNIDIDAENLFLSPNEDYLFFMNKNDLSLWALKLD